MLMRKNIVVLVLFSFHYLLNSQILSVDSIVSPNQLTEYKNQNLILLDFWATWCGPCVPATKQLEILQENFPNDVFIISISDEKNQKISNFIKEKPIKLLVASDYKSTLTKKYNIIGRPYSILLNKRGNKLWEGKPGDMTAVLLNKFIQSETKSSYGKKTINDIIVQQDSFSRRADITIKPIPLDHIQADYRKLIAQRKYTYVGTLKSFISEYKQIPLILIDENEQSMSKIGIQFPESYSNLYNKSILADSVLKSLNISLYTKEIEYKTYELNVVDKSMLWDTTQIVWEAGSPPFLIGDVSLEANNVSLKELAHQLSNSKDEIYLYNGTNNELYDFSFVYSDNKLMQDELLNTFGIKIEKRLSKVLRYNFEIFEYKPSSIDIE